MNSARDRIDSDMSQAEVTRLTAQNEELKSKIQTLCTQLEGKTRVEFELKSL